MNKITAALLRLFVFPSLLAGIFIVCGLVAVFTFGEFLAWVVTGQKHKLVQRIPPFINKASSHYRRGMIPS